MALEGVAPPTGRPGFPAPGHLSAGRVRARDRIASGRAARHRAPLLLPAPHGAFPCALHRLIVARWGPTTAKGSSCRSRFELVAYLPVLVLIYTPFLPLQDGLLRGERRSFLDCVQLVLERLPHVFLSVILQILIAFVPPSLILGGIVAALNSLPSKHEPWQQLVLYMALAPCLVWIGIVGFFLIYAIPLLVLEKRGPLKSIRLSFDLVAHRFSGILGRLFVFLCLFMLAAIALSMPEAMIQAWSSVARVDHPAVRISAAIWSAGVSAVMFPFSVAALMVLFRSSVPAGGAARGRTRRPRRRSRRPLPTRSASSNPPWRARSPRRSRRSATPSRSAGARFGRWSGFWRSSLSSTSRPGGYVRESNG